MALVGRGGQGDVGQRIRDEILVVQVHGSKFYGAKPFSLSCYGILFVLTSS